MEQSSSLQAIAQALCIEPKGVLAADQSNTSMNALLKKVGAGEDEATRQRYRELLFGTEGIEEYVTGVILYDETIRQSASDGTPFTELLIRTGIIPGIKVDKGLVALPNFPDEQVTEGLDGLAARLKEYYAMGARFAKWRAVIKIGEGLPTDETLHANAHVLTRYAALCQQENIVPMVEPEVLYDGTHTIEQSRKAITHTMRALFDELQRYRVALSGLILKTSMALPGKASGVGTTPQEVAEHTLRALRESVPSEVAGVVFLSGGQTPVQATENLNAIEQIVDKPWPMTFSYSRAVQEPALEAWRGDDALVSAARAAFLKRVKLNSIARKGEYTAEMEQ